ncbi:hypothetical protein ACR79T_10205 [Sphingobacterium spiritivorum]|uniref:hypothetical protein n=1 Tax=Sphingobacterium spiritivorum TaxID=258 RepID=UPI003DA1C9A3
MYTIEIEDKGLLIELPSAWEECNDIQVNYILTHAFLVMSGHLSIAEFRLKVFCLFTGLKLGLLYQIRQRLNLNKIINEQIYRLSKQLCNWVFERTEDIADEKYELRYNTIINFFPTLCDNLIGPQDLLSDITFGEFKAAIAVMDEYFDEKDNPELAGERLNYLLAMLYRPVKDGARCSFQGFVVEPDAVKNVPAWIKQSILIWFTNCIKAIQTETLTINGIEIDFSTLFPQHNGTQSKSNKINFGWTGVLFEIAESGVFGDAKSTSETNLFEILQYLMKKNQENKSSKK